VQYVWRWGDGTPDSEGSSPDHTFAAAGIYNVALEVTDAYGETSTPDVSKVTVLDLTPEEKKRRDDEAGTTAARSKQQTSKTTMRRPQAWLAGTVIVTAASGAVSVNVRCSDQTLPCVGTIALSTTIARRHASQSQPQRREGARVTIAGGHFSVASGKTGAVRLQLSALALHLLANRGVLDTQATLVDQAVTGLPSVVRDVLTIRRRGTQATTR